MSSDSRVCYLDCDLEGIAIVLTGGIGPEGVTLAEQKDERLMADNANMFVLMSPPKSVPTAYGAHSFNVIVPSNIKLRVPPEGHSAFFFLHDYSTNASSVNLYRDVVARIGD